jgi:hypothetical protein
LKTETPGPARERTRRILRSASGNVCDAGHVQQSVNTEGKSQLTLSALALIENFSPDAVYLACTSDSRFRPKVVRKFVFRIVRRNFTAEFLVNALCHGALDFMACCVKCTIVLITPATIARFMIQGNFLPDRNVLLLCC